MKWRRISEEEVRFVMENPEKMEETLHGRRNEYRHLGNRYLKVTLKEFENEILIISAVDKND